MINIKMGIEEIVGIEDVFDRDESATERWKTLDERGGANATVAARRSDFAPVAQDKILKVVGEGERAAFFFGGVRDDRLN